MVGTSSSALGRQLPRMAGKRQRRRHAGTRTTHSCDRKECWVVKEGERGWVVESGRSVSTRLFVAPRLFAHFTEATRRKTAPCTKNTI